eukprot:g8525.t1
MRATIICAPLVLRPNLVLSPIQRCVQIIINYGGALVVLLNSMVLLFQLEMEGRTVAFDLKLGLNEGQDFNEVLPSFRVIDSIFIFIFLGELLLRVAVERLDWLKAQLRLGKAGTIGPLLHKVSLPSLCWSMLLLAVFMCMGGLILGNLLQNFIKDETLWQRGISLELLAQIEMLLLEIRARSDSWRN